MALNRSVIYPRYPNREGGSNSAVKLPTPSTCTPKHGRSLRQTAKRIDRARVANGLTQCTRVFQLERLWPGRVLFERFSVSLGCNVFGFVCRRLREGALVVGGRPNDVCVCVCGVFVCVLDSKSAVIICEAFAEMVPAPE